MKARRFAIGRTKIKKIQPDGGEEQIRRPGRDPGRNSLGGDVAGLIVVDDFYVLQIPRFRFWPVESVSRNVIGGDIVVRVLLENLHIVKRVAAEAKILNKPGASVSPIAKDLSFDIAFGPRSRFGEKSFARELGVRCKRIIERHACCYRE